MIPGGPPAPFDGRARSAAQAARPTGRLPARERVPMMAAMGTFDTALMDALLSVGISPERARAVVESLDRSIDGRYGLHAQVLATKRDLAELETRLTREIGACREPIAAGDARISEVNAGLTGRINEVNAGLTGRINELNANLTGRINELNANLTGRINEVNANLGARIAEVNANLSARLAESRTELLKWMLAAVTAQTALLAGLFKLL
jgi:DNA anti-recombination protein RmuC